MSSHQPTHTGHELSRARSHEGDRGDRPAVPSADSLAQQLKSLRFPAQKADILSCAQREHLDHRLTERLQRLPEQPYQDFADVSRGLGQLR